MRFGKRSLAGLASGALLLSGIAIVAAQPAQAAPTTSVYCSNATGGGSAGTLPDVTTVQPNCVLPVSVGFPVTFDATNFMSGSVTWVQMTITGDSTWDSGAAAPSVVSADGKTITFDVADFAEADMSLGSAGTRTVSVELSAAVSATPPAQSTFADGGTLTVTGTGNAAQALVSQGYYVVDDSLTAGIGALAIVHIVDAQGLPLNLATATTGPIVASTAGGTLAWDIYSANDCDSDGTFDAGVTATHDAGDLDGAGIAVPACEVTAGAGIEAAPNLGYWLTYEADANTAPGTYTATSSITLGTTTYPVTVNYTVSTQMAVTSSGLSFDAAEYLPGATVTASFGLKDINGLPTPDGLWNPSTQARSWAATSLTNAPIFNPTDGTAVAPTSALIWPTLATGNNVITYNGTATGVFLAPANSMDVFAMTMVAGATAANGWATGVVGESWTATARIGNPTPVEATIMIEGARGKGDEAKMVFVEGVTTELVGSIVTPYFRFPGQTGMTAGTGTRTVDAQGNFSWQRVTGKRIAVQFRAGDIKSNTVIIEAR